MSQTALQTVLYVDDESDIRDIVQLALRLMKGLIVHIGESGEQALELSRELRPDLLLLDVMMPGLDGPGTLKRMREDPAIAHIPVIFMTAKAMPREVALFRKMGAMGVIAKPFDPMELSKQVVALWNDRATEICAHG
jgi:two-component system, OmpR family, response regulator